MSGAAKDFHFVVRSLRKDDDRSGFSSGNSRLDVYIRNQARQDIEKKVAATFVLIDTNTGVVAGFYSLAATAVALDQFPPEINRKLPRYPLVPATLLGRLAVDARYREKGLGEFLLLDAMTVACILIGTKIAMRRTAPWPASGMG